jgi:hypothetical protein
MSELVSQVATAIAGGIIAYHAVGWLRARMARPVEPPAPEAEPSLARMLRLDQPKSRASTLRLGRDLLDQHEHDSKVGLIVIAIEPDGMTTSHAHMSPHDLLLAANSLLHSAAKSGTGEVARRAATAAIITGGGSIRA